MRQKFLIFAALFFLIIVLIGLNAASYVQKEKTPDSEITPNRSTFNVGATGTRAFYDLLAETGRKATRWQEPPSTLLDFDKNRPQTFVVIGEVRRKFDDKEIEQLLRWVSYGGKLVIIDRRPPTEFIKTTASWSIFTEGKPKPEIYSIDPSDQKQMTEKVVAAKPIQPTVYTKNVNAVQPSLFASSINFQRFSDSNYKGNTTGSPKIAIRENSNYNKNIPPPMPKATFSEKQISVPPPPPASIDDEDEKPVKTDVQNAPVAHLANDEKTLLADFPFGSGKIVFLSDPFIVSNNGINLVDNAQLAINIVEAGEGIVAFDEFHQGYGEGESRLLGYFAGTPLIAIFLQFAALVGLILFTQSRRFARPLPEVEPNRLSKLEYVAAMAELQQRTRAFDLALENIYTDFRRRVSRLVGADNLTASYKDLARLIAERGNFNQSAIEKLMFKCEDIIRGEPTNKREILNLTGSLREIEEKLGLQRRNRKRRDN